MDTELPIKLWEMMDNDDSRFIERCVYLTHIINFIIIIKKGIENPTNLAQACNITIINL